MEIQSSCARPAQAVPVTTLCNGLLPSLYRADRILIFASGPVAAADAMAMKELRLDQA